MSHFSENQNPKHAPLVKDALLWTLEPRRLDPDALQRKCVGWLDDKEKTRHAALNDVTLRHEFLAAHALCRVALADATGTLPGALKFQYNRFGKPRLVRLGQNPALHFNLAHTRGLTALLISRAGPVGVDVEALTGNVDAASLAHHFLSPAAQRIIAALPAARRQRWFYEQWVLREALLKGRGFGLAGRLDDEPVLLDGTGSANVRHWRLRLFEPKPNVLLATAIRTRNALPATIAFNAGERLFEAGIAVVD